ncbi:MAG TPA: peptidylprolyl isomerase, partial [Ignavibacteriaceae bacterium]
IINDNEIEKVIDKKQTEYQIRWLYSSDNNDIANYYKQIINGASFDSLFKIQLNDSVLLDDRQLTSSLFNIYLKNPVFAQIIDTLKPGVISNPIHTNDGWYIIKIDNIWKSLITNQTEYEKLKYESEQAITKSKLDILSDEYVKSLFVDENPIIKRDAFNLLRSYLGKYVLAPEKYSEWGLDDKLDAALGNLGLNRSDKYPGLTLVECKSKNISLDEFIIWYRVREQYLKFIKDDLAGFSKSLEDLIWLMVRDKLVTNQAFQKGYDKSDWVVRQSDWWKQKICYSAYLNELANSITLDSEEIKLADEKNRSQSELLSEKLSKKILYKVLELKKNYKITVNKELLDDIKVSSENDKKAIDMYIVKRGNLVPRQAFPTIDNEWVNWE